MRKLFSFFLVCYINYLPAQDTLARNCFEPSFNLYSGYIPQTYPTAPAGQLSVLASTGITWQFNGKDKWHQFYNYPKSGLELFYGWFNNPAEFGYLFGFVPTLELPNKKQNKKWKWKLGLGAAYFSTPYNLISNPNNFYIGSHFTNMTNISFSRESRIGKKLLGSFGLSLIHCSNGHSKLPNVGLNIFAAHVGFRIADTSVKRRHFVAPEKNKWGIALKAGVGMHEFGATTKAIGGPSYPSYHVSLWYFKPFKNIHVLQLGLTGAYYTSFYDYITSQGLNPKKPRLYASTGLFLVGHEFIIGKFGLCTQAGFYFYNAFFIKQKKIEGSWKLIGEKLEAFNTNRLGLVYYPFKKKNSLNNIKGQLAIGAFIKANLGQADLFEYSLSYSF